MSIYYTIILYAWTFASWYCPRWRRPAPSPSPSSVLQYYYNYNYYTSTSTVTVTVTITIIIIIITIIIIISSSHLPGDCLPRVVRTLASYRPNIFETRSDRVRARRPRRRRFR